ncbi:cyclic pyranopterin monophosphate synthase MoaC [Acidobacteria bacterium ACD]|nr:MAG: cyclic pyranopterin monophosphate synthase MoaC [Acidobacteriota bacterium]MDL1949522.1 cyclic pyranopterin monophosphate synthase MoaC [Acidobacteria bacterium ACD]
MPRSRRTPELTHLDPSGGARMVDVSGKAPTPRSAEARALVRLGPRAYAALDASENRKGDALAVARVAGIAAAKRTADWIPLCHPLLFDAVEVVLRRRAERHEVEVLARVRGTGRTGYEMEALVAASAAALTLYDMCKAADKGIVIGPVELTEKSGGKSGSWVRGQKPRVPARPRGR